MFGFHVFDYYDDVDDICCLRLYGRQNSIFKQSSYKFFFHSGKNDFLLSFLGGDSVTAVAAAAVVQFHCEFDLKNISRHHHYMARLCH